MIPKVIHYCWFGRGEKPKLAQKCIASWKKYCPDYEIVEWNEDNFDISKYEYTKYMYEQKKYAFLSDFVRLIVIYENGGIYFDTDVEVIKPMDVLLENEAFIGFENGGYVNSGQGFGSEKGNEGIRKMIEEYSYFPNDYDQKEGPVGCPDLNTKALERIGLEKNGMQQNLKGITVYPLDFFNPYDSVLNRLSVTNNTYTIHWYAGSWISRGQKVRTFLLRPVHRLLGKNFFGAKR